MPDSSDYLEGCCVVYGGHEFDICLITEVPGDCAIVSCRHDHFVC